MTGPITATRSVGGPTRRLRTASARRSQEVGAVEQRGLDDGQRGGRALLAGVPERRADEVAQGEVDVGGLADRRGRSCRWSRPAGGGRVASRGTAAPCRRTPVSTTPSTPGWVTRWRPTSSSGQWHELHDVLGDAGGVGVADDLDADRNGLRRRLQEHRVAGGQGGDDAVGRGWRAGSSTARRRARRPSGSAAIADAASSSSWRVHAAAHVAKSMASETSGSPSRTVLPVSWAMTAIVRPRSAAITSATRHSARAALGRRGRPPAGGAGPGRGSTMRVDAGGGRHEGRARRRAIGRRGGAAIQSPVGALGEVGVGLVGERPRRGRTCGAPRRGPGRGAASSTRRGGGRRRARSAPVGRPTPASRA